MMFASLVNKDQFYNQLSESWKEIWGRTQFCRGPQSVIARRRAPVLPFPIKIDSLIELATGHTRGHGGRGTIAALAPSLQTDVVRNPAKLRRNQPPESYLLRTGPSERGLFKYPSTFNFSLLLLLQSFHQIEVDCCWKDSGLKCWSINAPDESLQHLPVSSSPVSSLRNVVKLIFLRPRAKLLIPKRNVKKGKIATLYSGCVALKQIEGLVINWGH